MMAKRGAGWPVEIVTLLYIVIWIPYVALTRMLATVGAKPLTGLELLPAQVIATAVAIYVFFFLGGWWRSAHRTASGLPRPTGWTGLSGLATSLILVSVPLSLTFPDVSIPFALLLMRGDILIIAPLVDLLSGRKVRWYSWLSLVVVLAGLVATVWHRGSLHIPLPCALAVLAYVVGYFIRLFIMTRCAKRDDVDILKAYFVEEQIVAYPATILLLGLGIVLLPASQAAQLQWGFLGIWHDPGLWLVLATGVLIAIIGVIAAIILLNPRENTFCVPLERSASVLGGLVAAYVLSGVFHVPPPSGGDLVGALLLIAAIFILTLAPLLTPRKAAARIPGT